MMRRQPHRRFGRHTALYLLGVDTFVVVVARLKSKQEGILPSCVLH